MLSLAAWPVDVQKLPESCIPRGKTQIVKVLSEGRPTTRMGPKRRKTAHGKNKYKNKKYYVRTSLAILKMSLESAGWNQLLEQAFCKTVSVNYYLNIVRRLTCTLCRNNNLKSRLYSLDIVIYLYAKEPVTWNNPPLPVPGTSARNKEQNADMNAGALLTWQPPAHQD